MKSCASLRHCRHLPEVLWSTPAVSGWRMVTDQGKKFRQNPGLQDVRTWAEGCFYSWKRITHGKTHQVLMFVTIYGCPQYRLLNCVSHFMLAVVCFCVFMLHIKWYLKSSPCPCWGHFPNVLFAWNFFCLVRSDFLFPEFSVSLANFKLLNCRNGEVLLGCFVQLA